MHGRGLGRRVASQGISHAKPGVALRRECLWTECRKGHRHHLGCLSRKSASHQGGYSSRESVFEMGALWALKENWSDLLKNAARINGVLQFQSSLNQRRHALPLQWFPRYRISAAFEDGQRQLRIHYTGYHDSEDGFGAIQHCKQVLTPIYFRNVTVIEDYANSVRLANSNCPFHCSCEQQSPALLNRTDPQIVLTG